MMQGFLSRLAQSLATLLVMSFLVFCLIGLMPGDPVDLMAAGNPHMTPADAERLRAYYGLDQPLVHRYGHWLAAAARGDFGYSRLYGLPVTEVLGPRLVNSLVLVGAALLLTLLLAVPLAVAAAARPDGPLDRALSFVALAGLSLPAFWLGLLLIGLFAVTLGWLQAAARLDHPASLILPVATLSLGMLAAYVRHLRTAMAEALAAEHIKTARAKGCSRPRVLWRHAFPLAATPLVTLVLLDIGALLGGALTVETVFAFPGMGKLLFDAVMGNDFNLALIGFFLLTACVLAANLLADTLYGWLDPRSRLGRERRRG
jgi:peptide/nickel transport system permease protein